MKLVDMSWDEAVKKCKGKIILVPHGSTEEHGYHLPLKTDAFIAEKICESFYNSKEIIVAPVMRYTGLRATKQMPGTVGPNVAEYEQWTRTIVSDLMKLKPRKVFFFLAHDGGTNRTVLDKLKEEFGKGKLDYLGSGTVDAEAKKLGLIESGGHAGEGETSLMLYLDSENVKMNKAVDEEWPDNWKEIGITKSGSSGYPTKATARKGKKLFEFQKKRLRESLLK